MNRPRVVTCAEEDLVGRGMGFSRRCFRSEEPSFRAVVVMLLAKPRRGMVNEPFGVVML